MLVVSMMPYGLISIPIQIPVCLQLLTDSNEYMIKIQNIYHNIKEKKKSED